MRMWRYIGNGKECVPEVPMRDLTPQEWEELTPVQKRRAKHLYQREDPPKPQPVIRTLMAAQEPKGRAEQETRLVRQSGNLSPARFSALVKTWATGSLPIIASYDDIGYFLQGIFGSVSPSGTASPYTWTYAAPASNVAVTPKFYTVEYGDATNKYKMTSMLVKSLGISGDAEGLWEATAELLGYSLTTLTSFAELSERAVPLIRGADMELYSDAWDGTMGSTKLDATLRSFDLNIDPGRHLKWMADGDLTPASYGDGDWSASLTTVLEFNASAKALLDALVGGAKVQRQLEIEANADETDTIALQFCGTLVNSLELWGDAEGNKIMEFQWDAEYNPTFANWFKCIVTNSLDALA